MSSASELHRAAYQHKTTKKMEAHYLEVLKKLNREKIITNSKGVAVTF